MRKTTWPVAAAVLALLLVAPAAHADHGRGEGTKPKVVPAINVGGSSGADLLGDWMAQLLALPKPENPLAGNAELCLDLGRHGKVLSPAGGIWDENWNIEMDCDVEVGRPVLMVMPTGECSSAEERPYYARTERGQQACAVRALEGIGVTSITLSVDGGRAVEIRNRHFLAVSGQERVVFPKDPIWGNPGRATFAAASWIAEIRGMQRGHHVVVGTTSLIIDGQPFSLQFTVHFNVGGRGR